MVCGKVRVCVVWGSQHILVRSILGVWRSPPVFLPACFCNEPTQRPVPRWCRRIQRSLRCRAARRVTVCHGAGGEKLSICSVNAIRMLSSILLLLSRARFLQSLKIERAGMCTASCHNRRGPGMYVKAMVTEEAWRRVQVAVPSLLAGGPSTHVVALNARQFYAVEVFCVGWLTGSVMCAGHAERARR